MNDNNLEKILRSMSGGGPPAPEGLVASTKQAVHGKRAVPVAVFFSLAVLIVGVVSGGYTLATLDISRQAMIFGLTAFLLSAGAVDIIVVASRRKIASFFIKIEKLTSQRI